MKVKLTLIKRYRKKYRAQNEALEHLEIQHGRFSGKIIDLETELANKEKLLKEKKQRGQEEVEHWKVPSRALAKKGLSKLRDVQACSLVLAAKVKAKEKATEKLESRNKELVDDLTKKIKEMKEKDETIHSLHVKIDERKGHNRGFKCCKEEEKCI